MAGTPFALSLEDSFNIEADESFANSLGRTPDRQHSSPSHSLLASPTPSPSPHGNGNGNVHHQTSGRVSLEPTLVFIVIWQCLTASLTAHKEPRFLLPALAPCMAVCGYALHVLERWALAPRVSHHTLVLQAAAAAADSAVGNSFLPRLGKRVFNGRGYAFAALVYILISLSLGLTVIFTRMHQAGAVTAVEALNDHIAKDIAVARAHDASRDKRASVAAAMDAGVLSRDLLDQLGSAGKSIIIRGVDVVFFLPCHSTPYASMLHGLGMQVVDDTDAPLPELALSPRISLSAAAALFAAYPDRGTAMSQSTSMATSSSHFFAPKLAGASPSEDRIRLRYLDCSPVRVRCDTEIAGAGVDVGDGSGACNPGLTRAVTEDAALAQGHHVRLLQRVLPSHKSAAKASTSTSTSTMALHVDYVLMYGRHAVHLSPALAQYGFSPISRFAHELFGADTDIWMFKRATEVTS